MKSFILLDRSGSMVNNWTETISSINSFVELVSEKESETKFTVAAFDSMGFDVVRDKKKKKNWKNISTEEIQPRSMTPLLDAVGKLNSLVKGKKCSILILTDGMENASREMTRDGVKAIIDEWKKKDYDVTFIGADFNAFADASSIGIGVGQTLNASKKKIGETFTLAAARTTSYYSGDSMANAEWTEKERKEVS